jgi:hypothetical protein
MIKLITENLDGDRIELDVNQDVRIVLRKQLMSLTDIDQRRGDYTQSFPLPRSEANDAFFGQWGDPSTIGVDWNSRVETPAWLLENDNIIVQGVLKLESVNPRHDKYYITVSGDVATIRSILGESGMDGLDYSSWIYTPSQIYSTWSRSIFGGDMVFTIHDVGFGWGLYKKAGTGNVLQDWTNSSTPLILDQCIPAFRLNELLRKMWNEKGYTIEGSWFSESEVEEIYVQADNALAQFATGASLFTANVQSRVSLDTTTRKVGYACSPIHSDFSNVNNQYTAPVAGTYYFDFNFTPSPGVPSSHVCFYGWYKNGVLSGSNINFNWNAAVNVTGKSFVLAAGDTLDIRVTATGGYSVNGDIFPSGSYLWKLTSMTPTGASVDPSNYWSNHKQIDFFRGIVKIFNLIPWFTSENKLRLDTWDYFMANYGSKKDWTGKIDIPSMVTKPINGELRNPINLELQDADHVLNIEYKNQIGRAYGAYNEDQNIPGTQDQAKQIETFSPACLQGVDPNNLNGKQNDNIVFCKYYETEDSLAFKSGGIQLMYYNGTRSGGGTIYTTDSQGGATTARTVYPYFSNFRLYSASSWKTLATTLDLNFTWWTPPANSIVTAPSEQGLFNRYFKNMMLERYDLANKLVEFNAVLDAVDIQTFSFADVIICEINGTPVGFRIMEINDYSPNSKRLTKIKAYITFIDP